MAYDITALKTDLEGVLHGTTLNQITGVDNLINRAGRQLLLDIDPQETKRIVQIGTPIFNDIFSYPLPSDLKGNKVIDIRPQVNRTLRDRFNQSYNQDFDIYKDYVTQSMFTINFNSSIKTIRIDATQLDNTGIILNQAESITDNGTWTVGGDATNLTVDNVNFVNAAGSLRFDLSGAGTSGFLENSTMTAQNLSEHEDQSSLFLYTFLPTGSDFTSVELRWGSSSTDFWSRTVTVTQENTAFQNGWNLLKFDWAGATVTGAPDSSAIDYLRVTWNYNGTAQTAVRLNGIQSQLGQIMELEYYSKFLFRDLVTGAYQETVTDDSNLINLDTESFNLLTYQSAYLAAQQQQGVNALAYDSSFFLSRYLEGIARYKGMYKSEITKPRSQYYRQPNPSYRRYFGWRDTR